MNRLHFIKYLYSILVIMVISNSCTKIESPSCPNINQLDGYVAINNDAFVLHQAEIVNNSGIELLDAYEIIFEAIDRDCLTKHRFRFYATVDKGTVLEGEFEFLDSNQYTVGKITSFQYVVFDPSKSTFTTQILQNIIVKIGNEDGGKYSIFIKGTNVDGNTFELKLIHRF